MKPVASVPDPAVSLGLAVERLPRRWPIATTSVLTITAVHVTALQFPFPRYGWRCGATLKRWPLGQWWRPSRPCSSSTTHGGRSSSCSSP